MWPVYYDSQDSHWNVVLMFWWYLDSWLKIWHSTTANYIILFQSTVTVFPLNHTLLIYSCKYLNLFKIDNASFTPTTVLVKINLPPASGDDDAFYICTKDAVADITKVFAHQGTENITQVGQFCHFKCLRLVFF